MTFDITTVKKVMLYVGIAAALVAVWMTFSYGRTMTFAHGIAMGLLTLVAAFIWTAADHYKKNGMKTAGNALFVLGVMFTAVEYFSHVGYTVGNRVTVAEDTGVQNAAYQGAQKTVTENQDTKAALAKVLADMQHDNPWVASATPDGLQADVEAANVTIPESRKFCDRRADLKNRIALALKFSATAAQMDKLQTYVDGKRDIASKTEFKSSPIVNQTRTFAQLATWDIEPSQAAMNWTQILIGALIAFVTTFLAPTCFFIVFGDSDAAPPRSKAEASGRANHATPLSGVTGGVHNMPPPAAPQKPDVHKHYTITDESAAEKLRAYAKEMRNAINLPRAVAA